MKMTLSAITTLLTVKRVLRESSGAKPDEPAEILLKLALLTRANMGTGNSDVQSLLCNIEGVVLKTVKAMLAYAELDE